MTAPNAAPQAPNPTPPQGIPQPDPNQYPQPQYDPNGDYTGHNDDQHEEVIGPNTDESNRRYRTRWDRINEQLDGLDEQVRGYADSHRNELYARIDAVGQYVQRRQADPQNPLTPQERAGADRQYRDLAARLRAHDALSDHELARAYLDHYSQTEVAQARINYAGHLAARGDSSASVRTGRKGQVGRAQLDYEVAYGFVAAARGRLSTPEGAEFEEAQRIENEKTLQYLLGNPGEGLDNNSGELFKLAREKSRQRLIQGGQFVESTDPYNVNIDGMPNLVEKQAGNWIVRRKRDFQGKWNEWTEVARDKNEPMWRRVVAVAKKALVVGGGGVLAAAGGATLGAAAGAAVGIGIGVGAAKLSKAAAAARLNRNSNIYAETTVARDHRHQTSVNLAEARDYYEQQINGGANFSLIDTSHEDVQTHFTDQANKRHRRNQITAGVAGVVALVGGTLAGEAAHSSISNALGGEDTPRSRGATSAPEQPDTNDKPWWKEATEELDEKKGEPTEPEKPQGPTQPEQPKPTEPEQPKPSEPQQPKPAEPTPKPGDTEKPQGPTAPEEKPGEKPADKPDGKPGTGVDAGPEVGNGKPVTVTPEDMEGKWVSEVYAQLGDGGYQEMMANAQAAIDAGEIEIVDADSDEPTTMENRGNNYYFRLTEAGAKKLGGDAGSSQTLDVMKALTSHSKKLNLG